MREVCKQIDVVTTQCYDLSRLYVFYPNPKKVLLVRQLDYQKILKTYFSFCSLNKINRKVSILPMYYFTCIRNLI